VSDSANDAPLQSIAPRAVDIGAIERELEALWATGDADAVVARACMSNLVVFCTTPTAANLVVQEMGLIAQSHPARVVLLVGGVEDATSELEAYVSTQCHLAGEGRQVCSEHVTVNASRGAERRLPSVARPLLIGDLPTTLWWVSEAAPPTHGSFFHELAMMSDHVIYDSAAWLDPTADLVSTADWALAVDTEQIAADVAWLRLKRWRRWISQTLDPAVEPGFLAGLDEVVIEHGPHALPQAWLLVGWLAGRLGWRPVGGRIAPGVEIALAFETPQGKVALTIRRSETGDAELRCVVVRAGIGGDGGRMTFSAEPGGRLALRRGAGTSSPRLVSAPEIGRAGLVARQLPELGRDVSFLNTLAMSRAMARSLG